METTTILSIFLKLVSGNKIFRQSHMSLFSAILTIQDRGSKLDKFRLSGSELMKYSAIRSYMTYHRCKSDLVIGFLWEIMRDRHIAESPFPERKGASRSWA